MKLRRRAKIAAIACLAAAAAGWLALSLLDIIYPFPLQRIDDRLAAASLLLRAADDSLLAWRVDREDNRRLGAPLEDISPWLVVASIAVEDKRFRNHRGVDPVAVCRAALQNLASGRRVSGASTITMQTIRLLWPRPRRMRSKIVESFRAWQLERLADKDRILEIYLNLAPYGGNLIGAEAASRRYFGKSASQLTLPEAALLAGLPQSPSRLNPLRHPGAAKQRRDFVIRRLLEDGHISLEQARHAWNEDFRIIPPDPRTEAPHFADRIAASGKADGRPIASTLDANLQRRVAELAEARGRELAAKGVSGPAVVVLSVANASVLAYVGNASPAGAPARQVDGVRIKRQPGSLLKPFIFALLAERGNIAPSTLVYDLPRAWPGYAPRNMDREWHGAMTAADALRDSRNITAVGQLAEVGVESFADFMRAVGLEPADPGRHGLTAALGGKEQNLLALANAYGTLGRLGIWLPPRLRRDAPVAVGHSAISPAAAWLALAAIAPAGQERAPAVVWKTGTSWNQLDAWAVAMNRDTVVGVWCGRLSRGGLGWTAGADDALPLALDALEAATEGNPGSWPPPRGVEFGQICAASGSLPGLNCPETRIAPVLSGNHGNLACPVHSRPAPSGVGTASTAARPERQALRILSPVSGTTYVSGNGATLPLLAETAGPGEMVWFLNGARLGASCAGQSLDWPLSPGNHRLSVSDGSGGVASAEIRVVGK